MLAWGLLGVELLVFATFPWIDHLLRRAGRADLTVMDPFSIPPTVAALTAGAVGAVLASRRPRHPVGWLLLAMGVVMAVSGASVGYIPYGLLARPGSLFAANIVARVYPATIYAVLAIIALSCCSPRPGRRRRCAGGGGPGARQPPSPSPWRRC
jgi:hypothetical protein